MVRRRPFEIVYDPEVRAQVDAIAKRHHALIRRTIEQQLTFDADVESRNRKPLTRAVEFEAEWELRFGPDNRFRVFYAIDADAHEVQVLAIGEKHGNRLTLGGEEVQL